MIDWIDDLGNDWGRYLRKTVKNGYPETSIMGRIREEGSVGAAIRTFVQVIPIQDIPADVLVFHRAWNVTKSRYKKLIFVRYVPICPTEEKLIELGLTERTYYYRLDRSHSELRDLMDLQKEFAKTAKTATASMV